MKYVHWAAYPALILIVGYLVYVTVDQAVWLDDMKQGAQTDREAVNDLLRYIAVNSACDKSPEQLAAAMGKGYEVLQSHPHHKGPVVAHFSFVAKYNGKQLVGVEDVNLGSVAVCTEKQSVQ